MKFILTMASVTLSVLTFATTAKATALIAFIVGPP
jgi:hypothetical protein